MTSYGAAAKKQRSWREKRQTMYGSMGWQLRKHWNVARTHRNSTNSAKNVFFFYEGDRSPQLGIVWPFLSSFRLHPLLSFCPRFYWPPGFFLDFPSLSYFVFRFPFRFGFVFNFSMVPPPITTRLHWLIQGDDARESRNDRVLKDVKKIPFFTATASIS